MTYNQHARAALEDGLGEAQRALDAARHRLQEATDQAQKAGESVERAAARVQGLKDTLVGQPAMSVPITDSDDQDAVLVFPDRTATGIEAYSAAMLC